MKKTLIALSCAALAYTGQAQETAPLTVQPSLQHTLSQLDTDGEHLSVTNIDGDLRGFLGLVDKAVMPLIYKNSPDLGKMTSAGMCEIFGLLEAKTIGQSSKHQDGSYHNRIYLDTGGSDRGLLSLTGKVAKPWQAAAFAPKGSDLLLEFNLNLTQTHKVVQELAAIFPEKDGAKMTADMQEKLPGTEITLAAFLSDLDARCSVALRLDSSKKWQAAEGVQMPGIDACIRIDGLAKKLWPVVEPVLKDGAPYQSKGNVHTIPMPNKLPTPWGEMQPVAVVDLDKDHIWICLSEEFLKECQSASDKLTADEDFVKATKGLPETGFAMGYISPESVSTLHEVAQVFMTMLAQNAEELDLKAIDEKLNELASLKLGYAIAGQNDPQGLLIANNAPFASKGGSAMTPVMLISGLSAASFGPIQRNILMAKKVEALNEMKNICVALGQHSFKNDGEFPETLKDLATILPNKDLTTLDWPNKGDKLHYIAGFSNTDDVNTIILHSEPDAENGVMVARIDGAVTVISKEEFEKEMQKQEKK